jgi:hypothetical protein
VAVTTFGQYVAYRLRERAGTLFPPEAHEPARSPGGDADEVASVDFDGGARTAPARPGDMNSVIRRAAGFGG